MTNEAISKYWERVDMLKGGISLSEICAQAKLNYNRVKHNRSDMRLMNTEDTLALAEVLHTTVEYLLTGTEKTAYPPRIKAIADHLCTIPDQALDTVEAMVKALPSRQDESYISPKEA